MNAIFKRVSIRKFESRPVTEEQIELLLRAAMAAPTARNQQGWEFYVVTSEEVKAALAGCSPYSSAIKSAPLVIVPCCKEDSALPAYLDIDAAAATENILLEAVELGLGAVWMGVTPIPERVALVTQALNCPDNLRPFCMIALGHPAETRPQENRYDPKKIHRV